METPEPTPLGAPRLPPEAAEFLSPAEALAEAPPPRLARITLYLFGAMLVAGVAWSAFAQIEEIVYARGKLGAPDRMIVVQPLETAVIRSIEVREGEHVTKGQTLVVLDPTFSEADVAASERQGASLESQQRRLKAELAGEAFVAESDTDTDQLKVFDERRDYRASKLHSFDEAIAKIQAELETNRQSADVLGERLKTNGDMEAMQKTLLADQTGSRLKFLLSQDQRLTVQHDLGEAKNHIEELKHALASAEADRDSFQREWREKVSEDYVSVGRDLGQVRDTIAKARRRRELAVLTAPADGTVLEIAARSVSSVAREAEPLVTIVPSGARLEFEAQIDSHDIGQVRPQAPARIMVDSFPYLRYGVLPASVSVISRDSFSRDEQGRGSSSGVAYFQSRLTLGADRLPEQPDDVSLLPGMTATAEIVVGKRSILSYLFRPLAETFDRALHEP